MFRAWQRFLLIGVPGAAYLSVATAAWFLRDRLPDPLASHFTGGRPDASMPRMELIVVAFLPPVLAWLFFLFLVRLRRPGSAGRRLGAGLIVGQSLLYSTTIALGIIYANLDAATWRDAYSPTYHPVVATAVGVIGFILGAALVDPWRRPEEHALPASETGFEWRRRPMRTEGSGGTRRLWVSHARNRFLLWYSALGLVLFVLVFPRNAWTVISAVYTLLTAHLAGGVMVTFDGMTLKAYGFPRLFPLRRIPLSKIEVAEAVELDPLAWGGWGWRLLSLRRHALVVRGGEALLIALHGGGEFLVTVPDATTGAGLIRQALRGQGDTAGRRVVDIDTALPEQQRAEAD